LEGSVWVLESQGDSQKPQHAMENVVVSAQFNGARVAGNAGCNSYSANYELDGEQLKISEPIATRKFCSAAGVMDQEAQFLAALAQASRYRVEAERLTITCGADKVLNFRPQGAN
jgi:putative lipoprotein